MPVSGGNHTEIQLSATENPAFRYCSNTSSMFIQVNQVLIIILLTDTKAISPRESPFITGISRL